MKKKTKIKKLGECGVDSGQLFIIDPCYLSRFKNDEFNPDDKSNNNPDELSYSSACIATLSKDQGGRVGGRACGVATSTGFGDGCYPVYALISDVGDYGERVAGIFIDFQIKKFDLNNLI